MYMYMYINSVHVYICHDEATLQSFQQCYKCDTYTMFDVCTVWFVFIKLYNMT